MGVVSEREVDVATSGWRMGIGHGVHPSSPLQDHFQDEQNTWRDSHGKPILESSRYLLPSHLHLSCNYATAATAQHQAKMACCHGRNFLCPCGWPGDIEASAELRTA